MNEKDGVASWMTNNNDGTARMIVDTADSICLIFVREVELLNSLTECNVPQLKGMVLSKADKHVAKRTTLAIGSGLVHEQNGSRPGLLSRRRSRQRQQRHIDLNRVDTRRCCVYLIS